MKRDAKIDYMRCIGTLLVIMAHVKFPQLLHSIRTFDVVMLVFISGMSYRSKDGYGTYLKKRFKKLVIPTYVAAILMFGLSWLTTHLMGREALYQWENLLRSFLFLSNSLPYIWIVRIYIIIAIASPILFRIANQTKNCWELFGIAMLGIILAWLGSLLSGSIHGTWWDDYVVCGFAYSSIALCGMGVFSNKKKYMSNLFTFAFIGFVLSQIVVILGDGGFAPEQYKTPPSFNYLFYGLTCSIALYWVLPRNGNKLITWISKNSFSIYIFHILALWGYGVICKLLNIPQGGSLWLVLEFLVVVASAIITTTMFNFVGCKLRSISEGRKTS